jgi:hypothetical protein
LRNKLIFASKTKDIHGICSYYFLRDDHYFRLCRSSRPISLNDFTHNPQKKGCGLCCWRLISSRESSTRLLQWLPMTKMHLTIFEWCPFPVSHDSFTRLNAPYKVKLVSSTFTRESPAGFRHHSQFDHHEKGFVPFRFSPFP